MRDLNRHIVEQQAAQWERLGLELGLKDYHIANISKDNEHNPNRSVTCCRAMLEQWLREITSATWGKLDDAIKNIKLPLTISPVSTDKGGNMTGMHNMYGCLCVTKYFIITDTD